MEESETYPKEYLSPQPRRVTSMSSSVSTTSVHVTALDGLVNVNSLFTIAVFVGLSLTTPGQKSLEDRTACDAGIDVVKKLLGLKLAINLLNSKDVDEAFRAHINLKVLRLGMMASAIGSIRLGVLSCGSKSAIHAVSTLLVLVTSALVVYISTAIYAFLH
ncbi:hypothetical protein KY289_036243 [Solanum tuberosum]|nr:hypothetical protein KY289_036243 [Solanum tuberosum]